MQIGDQSSPTLEYNSQRASICFVFQQLLALLEHSITFPELSLDKKFPSVFRVLEAHIRTRKDSQTVNLAMKEKQPRLSEPPCAKTVASTKLPVTTRQMVRR